MQQRLAGMAHWLWGLWAFRLSWPPRPRYFLIIGNGRTGSTWLQTTLDQLPDVRTRLELKVRLPYQEPHPLHVYVDGSTVSIKDCILQACGVAPDAVPTFSSLGSKLIFDPYGYLGPEIFDRLGELLDKNIRTILLKRSYAAQFTSWKLRGVYHELNADAVSEAASVDQEFIDVVSSWKPPKLETMLFTLGDAPLAGADPKAVGPDAINYPAEDAVEDLLVLFYNDLTALALAQQQLKYAVVDYDEIGERFSGLARLVGSEASDEEIRNVLGRPITKRLQTLGPERTQPPGFLTRLSACLDIAFARAVTSQTSKAVLQWNQTGNAVLQWSPGKKFLLLNVEGLAEILSDYGVPYESPSSPDTAPKDRLVRWLRRRPIYEFADVGK